EHHPRPQIRRRVESPALRALRSQRRLAGPQRRRPQPGPLDQPHRPRRNPHRHRHHPPPPPSHARTHNPLSAHPHRPPPPAVAISLRRWNTNQTGDRRDEKRREEPPKERQQIKNHASRPPPSRMSIEGPVFRLMEINDRHRGVDRISPP